MSETVLITGGAGFIGTHVARALLRRGDRVRVLDSLIEQVHPPGAPAQRCLGGCRIHRGDMRDEAAVARALWPAWTRWSISPPRWASARACTPSTATSSVNDHGTAVLFQALIERPVARVVVASSMSIYGEGLYRAADGALVEDAVRPAMRRPRAPDGTRSDADGAAGAGRHAGDEAAEARLASTRSPNTCRSG